MISFWFFFKTFDECVTRQGPDCDPLNLWMQIPFFCGHHSSCWEAGNSWALQQAKSNLAKSYFLVGTTEGMEDFIAVLEISLPRFFHGALKYFQDGKLILHTKKMMSICSLF